MAKFVFRLATLLKLREAVRDGRRSRLGGAFAAAAKLDERIDEIEGDLSQLMEDARRQKKDGTLRLDELLEAQRFELVLRAERGVLDQQRFELEAEIQKRREALVSADREVRVLERLSEKQYEEFRTAEQRHQQKQLDEVAARRGTDEDEA